MKITYLQFILLIGLASGFILLQLISCQTKDKSCIAINQSLEITFEDTTLQDIRFSPFEEGKIWVKTGNKNNDIAEIDINNGQKIILNKERATFFYFDNDDGHIRYRHKDQYDSLIWVGGPNRNVVFYDQRTNIITELPVSYVTRIISRPGEVFFVSLQGFCYWDRATKSISQVSGIPSEFIQGSQMPDDTTIVLDEKYTYYFNSKQVKKEAGFARPGYNGKWESEGLGLFYNAASLWYMYNGKSEELPLPNNYINNTTIRGHKFWQSDNDFYYSFDPQSKRVENYSYKLPPVNHYSFDFQIDDRYIWIKRPGQVMLIDMVDKKQLEYPVQAAEGHVRTIINDCNVFSLYKNKIFFCSKEDFIKKCVPFDAAKYGSMLNWRQ